MGRISGLICFILAVLTVLSIAPVVLLSLACEFSPGCLVHGFGRFLVGPTGVRKPAVALLIGPLLVLLAYVLVFVRCHRQQHDVMDQVGRGSG